MMGQAGLSQGLVGFGANGSMSTPSFVTYDMLLFSLQA